MNQDRQEKKQTNKTSKGMKKAVPVIGTVK